MEQNTYKTHNQQEFLDSEVGSNYQHKKLYISAAVVTAIFLLKLLMSCDNNYLKISCCEDVTQQVVIKNLGTVSTVQKTLQSLVL